MMVGNCQGYCYLAVRLFPKLTAVLVRDPNRMLPLLRKARVIDDPRFDWSVTLDPGSTISRTFDKTVRIRQVPDRQDVAATDAALLFDAAP